VIISHSHRFIFIKTMKTAGTSIEAYLSPLLGPDDVVTPVHPPEPGHQPRNFRGLFDPLRELREHGIARLPGTLKDVLLLNRFYNHLSAALARSRLPKAIWRDYHVFCVERNPIDKTLSHYFMLRELRADVKSIDDYFRLGRFCHNLPFYTDQTGVVIVDQIIKYEHLDEELARLFPKLGVPFPGTLTTTAKASVRPPEVQAADLLDAAKRQRLRAVFDAEIRMHGYADFFG
jgi:hypothetical protein